MKSKMLGGIFLICGTSIGTGILGIPSVTAESGFLCSVVLFFICWLFSTLSALYYMEAHLWQSNPHANLLSMTGNFFGPTAKFIVWVIYLSLLYSLMCTYLLAGSSWVIESVHMLTHVLLGKVLSMFIFILLIGLFIFSGIRAVDRINRLMSFGLALSFIVILSLLLPRTTVSILFDKAQHIQAMPGALPLLITAFGYSIIVPSLNAYFDKQAFLLQKTIIIGSLLTLFVYLLWQVVTFGNIPYLGPSGLQMIAQSQDNGTEVANSLIYFAKDPRLSIALTLFAIFAVITSFLGVSMALYHALADGLNMQRYRFSEILVLVLTYLPPILFLLMIPTGFSQILSWAGALVALLMGLLPVAMVWKGRYVDALTGYRVYGGKIGLSLVALFFLVVVIAEFTR